MNPQNADLNSAYSITNKFVLPGPWMIFPDEGNEGKSALWFEKIHPKAVQIPVPGVIQQVFPEDFGVFWYWCSFTPPRKVESTERIRIQFGAVDYYAEVWLNGIFVGTHEGGELPFQVSINDEMRFDQPNLLAVRVINPFEFDVDGFKLNETPHRNKMTAQYSPGSMYNYGGITYPVNVVYLPRIRITDVFSMGNCAESKIDFNISIHNEFSTSALKQNALSQNLFSPNELSPNELSPNELSQNKLSQNETCLLCLTLYGRESEFIINQTQYTINLANEENMIKIQIPLIQPRFWSCDDPYFYRYSLKLINRSKPFTEILHEFHGKCAFRTFSVQNGYFYLNDKRIFLKSTHTGNHFPISQIVPTTPELLRKDMLYAKAMGFNMIRFISGMAYPEQLDFCDEIGLMVYEECYASWLLEDSPHMKDRFIEATKGMILRDRNHPSIVIWGLLNETKYNAVCRHAIANLELFRALDPTRLILLNSGRWDGQWNIGSVSNPGSKVWECVWGEEDPANLSRERLENKTFAGGYLRGAGDAHAYPEVPLSWDTIQIIRTLGENKKPIFLSEYGIGSLFNVIDEFREYQQNQANSSLADVKFIQSMKDRFLADWSQFGMDSVYPFPEDFFRMSYLMHAQHRRLGFDIIRSNPKICGYNLTGILDHALTGEGLWTFWRKFKPGVVDVVAEGWASLRWCILVNPTHTFLGKPITLQIILANEEVLSAGVYPAQVKISGQNGVVWEKKFQVVIPDAKVALDSSLAVHCFTEQIVITESPGDYHINVSLLQGGNPVAGNGLFHLSEHPVVQNKGEYIYVCEIPESMRNSLIKWGYQIQELVDKQNTEPAIILLGDATEFLPEAEFWKALQIHVQKGSIVLFLSHHIFESHPQFPFEISAALRSFLKGQIIHCNDWLYHKECIAKSRLLFSDLPKPGIMDWYYYGPFITHDIFRPNELPADIAAAAFAVGYSCQGGYYSGILSCRYKMDQGAFIINTFPILEQWLLHPVAEQMLSNYLTDCEKIIKSK